MVRFPAPALRGRGAAALVALGVAAGLAGGCATNRLAATRQELIEEMTARGVSPQQVPVPFDVDDEMREWLAKRVPKAGSHETRILRLLRQLLTDDNLGVQYQKGYTGTAREVFDSQAANCLSFSHLFVGLARELGVPVYYLGVREIQGFEKEGDLVIISGHITAGFGLPPAHRVLEFNLGPQVDYRNVVPLSDREALALHLSNRGAEQLRAGALEQAVTTLEMASRLDPELASAWVNRGVGLRRLDRWEEAEAAYREALSLDPGFVTAYQNLASLLRLRGRPEEAAELLQLVDRLGPRNPYSYLNLGDLAMARGRFDEARRYYRKAVRAYRGHADSAAAMGILELRTGNHAEAERWLTRARELDPEAERVRALENRFAATSSSR
jgi:Flp pilus assembly protein TadD